MMSLRGLLVGIVAVAMLLPGVQIAATFDPQRLRVVDTTNSGSCLVRGNAPVNKQGEFDPDMVIAAVHSLMGTTTSERDNGNYELVVVSLVSSKQSDERVVLEKELQFEPTADGPSVQVLQRPIVGSWTAPLPLDILHDFLKHTIWTMWRPDDGAWRLAKELHNLLRNSTGTHRRIIYVHCMRGMDRTGLVAGAYLMRYTKAAEERVHYENYSVAKRRLNWPASNALKWVAWKSRQENNQASTPTEL